MSTHCASGHCSCTSLLANDRAPSCANTRGLSIGGSFMPYQQGIQRLQRWRIPAGYPTFTEMEDHLDLKTIWKNNAIKI